MTDGVLLVDKPAGPTSHDVVDAVRATFAMRKVGHCGTLDPMATGLLVVVLGRATRLSQHLTGDDKAYEGHMILGIRTDTLDAAGQVVDRKPADGIDRNQVDEAFASMRGDLMQTPPMVSAVKQGGRPLYRIARKGREVERKPRLVHIYRLDLDEFDPPRVAFSTRCSKGTYVRVLCDDIGRDLGCGAHLGGLRRTGSGRFTVDEAIELEALVQADDESARARVLPLDEVARRMQD